MTIVPKSGWPVLGQTAVNSGQVISISYSRSGNWFGKVSNGAGIKTAPGPGSSGRTADSGGPGRVGDGPLAGPPPSILAETPAALRGQSLGQCGRSASV